MIVRDFSFREFSIRFTEDIENIQSFRNRILPHVKTIDFRKHFFKLHLAKACLIVLDFLIDLENVKVSQF